MNLADYKSQSIKIVSLPSGLKVKLKYVKVMSYVLSGSLPNVFNFQTGEIDLDKKDDPENVEKLVKNVLLDSVVSLIFDDAEAYLVDKNEKDCAANELSYDLLNPEDQINIFTKAFELSVPGGADNVKAFSAG
tara:strand:+ start:6398 stop:6796 length:399 start_codon:yes stop_codon:yes gene_type:complete